MDLTKVFEILKVEALDESAKAEVEKFITDLVDIKAKDKALEISEAVLAEAREELTEEFEQKFEDYKEETLSKWSDFVDSVIAEELQIPEEIKQYAKYGEQFKPILDQIRTQLGINEGTLDDTAKDLLKEAKSEIESLRSEYNGLMKEAMELREDAKEMAAHIYLRKKCDGLTEAQKTKVMAIMGDITDVKQINEKFELVLEHVLDEKKKHKKEEEEEELDEKKKKAKKCETEDEDLDDDAPKKKKSKKGMDGDGLMESTLEDGTPFSTLIDEYKKIVTTGTWK
jgi:hypothetical protein